MMTALLVFVILGVVALVGFLVVCWAFSVVDEELER